MTRNFFILCAACLIVAHLQLELSTLLHALNPDYAFGRIRPFLDPDYNFPSEDGLIQRSWWLKYICNDMYGLIIKFVLFKVAMKVSYLLGRVAAIFFLYTLFDHALLWYNYRSSGWHYLLINAAIIISIVAMFIPERKSGKVISMK